MIRTVVASAALVLLALPAATATESGQRSTEIVAGYGDVAYRPADRPLVDQPAQVRLVWQGPHHMGVGKGSSGSSVGPGMQLEDPDESFYGGCSSPIIAQGMVFVHYARPSGEDIDLAEVDPGRLERRKKEPPLFRKIRADDITVALDAATGRSAWIAQEQRSNANLGGGKRDHWTTSPVFIDGRVIVVNQLGAMFAYAARTGEKVWERAAPAHLLRRVEEAVAAGRQADIGLSQSSLAAADGVVIEPTGRGLRGSTPRPARNSGSVRLKRAATGR